MSQFRITVASDPDHEDLIAEVYFDDEFVALVTQERGFDALEIEIHPRKDGQPHKFMLAEFLETIALARTRLGELRRSTSPGSA